MQPIPLHSVTATQTMPYNDVVHDSKYRMGGASLSALPLPLQRSLRAQKLSVVRAANAPPKRNYAYPPFGAAASRRSTEIKAHTPILQSVQCWYGGQFRTHLQYRDNQRLFLLRSYGCHVNFLGALDLRTTDSSSFQCLPQTENAPKRWRRVLPKFTSARWQRLSLSDT